MMEQKVKLIPKTGLAHNPSWFCILNPQNSLTFPIPTCSVTTQEGGSGNQPEQGGPHLTPPGGGGAAQWQQPRCRAPQEATAGKGGSSVNHSPTEKGYLKRKAKVNVTFVPSKDDDKLTHREDSIMLVSIH